MAKLTATLLGAAAAASLAIGLGLAPAHAHVMAPLKTFKLKQGKDWGWVKSYTKNGRRRVQIGVCDKEYDGNAVYGDF
ncbi:hypothetical protein GCM10010191_61040 [Actinomadura vinacea]|uniref:Uncharacterized protein n=1 Tax=Actinomadura vinacea TaxID=115336 RepID=A0ABN3JRZ6_9ACTN